MRVPEADFLPVRALRRRWSALRITRESALCNKLRLLLPLYYVIEYSRYVRIPSNQPHHPRGNMTFVDSSSASSGRQCFHRDGRVSRGGRRRGVEPIPLPRSVPRRSAAPNLYPYLPERLLAGPPRGPSGAPGTQKRAFKERERERHTTQSDDGASPGTINLRTAPPARGYGEVGDRR